VQSIEKCISGKSQKPFQLKFSKTFKMRILLFNFYFLQPETSVRRLTFLNDAQNEGETRREKSQKENKCQSRRWTGLVDDLFGRKIQKI
jgi:hypothetical protein